MEAKTVSIKRCFRKAFEAFKTNPVPSIFGFFFFIMIKLVGQMIPFVGIAFTIFLDAAFIGGAAILALNLIRNEQPAIENIFSGFKKYKQFMGTYWLYVVIMLLSPIPFVLGVLLCLVLEPIQFRAFRGGYETVASFIDITIFVIVIASIVISIIVYMALLMKWFFVYFIIADRDNEDTVIQAFKRSSRMTKGHRIKLLLTAVVIGLFGLSGIFVCGIGMFITIPITWCGIASVYNELKNPESDLGINI